MFRISNICQLLGLAKSILFSFPNPAFLTVTNTQMRLIALSAEVFPRFPCQVPQHIVSLGSSMAAHLLAPLLHQPISEAFWNPFDRNGIPTLNSVGSSPATVTSSFSVLLVFPPKPKHMVSSIRMIAENRIQPQVLPKVTVSSLTRRGKMALFLLVICFRCVLYASTHLGLVVVSVLWLGRSIKGSPISLQGNKWFLNAVWHCHDPVWEHTSCKAKFW